MWTGWELVSMWGQRSSNNAWLEASSFFNAPLHPDWNRTNLIKSGTECPILTFPLPSVLRHKSWTLHISAFQCSSGLAYHVLLRCQAWHRLESYLIHKSDEFRLWMKLTRSVLVNLPSAKKNDCIPSVQGLKQVKHEQKFSIFTLMKRPGGIHNHFLTQLTEYISVGFFWMCLWAQRLN